MMKSAISILYRRAACVLLALAATVAMWAADGIPDRPNPPRLVNDLAGLFSEATATEMEDSLRALSNRTSNQIVIVTVNDLDGYTPNEFATEIGDRWGVGQKKLDNGVVILIKPKTSSSKGQVYIATGRGLEGALPDVFCHRIVDEQMLPVLRARNDYAAATWAALKVIMPVCRGEYNYATYQQDEDFSLGDVLLALFVIVCVVIVLFVYTPFGGFFLPGGGSFTSGGSSSSSGGWSGFGGGSFGGGGAGGSW